MNKNSTEPLLKIEGLKQYFDVSKPFLNRLFSGEEKQLLKAVDGVDIEIEKGETFALVGESGCGKSTIARLVVGLHEPTGGTINFEGANFSSRSKRSELSSIRRRMTMIFQSPYASLNPRWRVNDIIAEPILAFRILSGKKKVFDRVGSLLEQVGLTPEDGEKFPHEFSGGQRQRISIARALASEPDFIVCDEPTSALDVSVQAQILNLMKKLQQSMGLTYMFISHDLAVVKHMSDHIGVMYLGRLCEVAGTDQLFSNPQHPYTQMLLDTIPDIGTEINDEFVNTGEVPNPINPPSGCTFHPRCPLVTDRCRRELPVLRTNTHQTKVACHAIEER